MITAEESLKTKKAREKLKRHLGEIEKEVTLEALQKKKEEIRGWISRNSSGRLKLNKEGLSLFDQNQHPASASAKVIAFLEKLTK